MRNILITGGAGFIGVNLAKKLAEKGDTVVVYDNLFRQGTEKNIEWLLNLFRNVKFIKNDIRSEQGLKEVFTENGPFDVVFHLAAQVTVTKSVVYPALDFELNAKGTFNVLEAFRKFSPKSIFLYSSTNKVYGKMDYCTVIERDGRYIYRDYPHGVSEDITLDFHSPYGCSKGCADQYTIDYSRIYGLKTIVLRQSCIYGYRQFGMEDQGWVAWFTIAALFDKDIVIYGDGKQVRDTLFIDDLINAYEMAVDNINITSGKAYNIGGCDFNMSLLELIAHLENIYNKKIIYSFSDWRPGDQRVFIADIKKAEKDFGWKPVIDVKTGIRKLAQWIGENRDLFVEAGIIKV
ncbi:MAG: SDR family NAD(P)-dependent oxidoreductase [bacterium]